MRSELRWQKTEEMWESVHVPEAFSYEDCSGSTPRAVRDRPRRSAGESLADRLTLASVPLTTGPNGFEVGTVTGSMKIGTIDYVVTPDGTGVILSRPPDSGSAPS